jgi:para-nitrobenzyl esterase
MRIELSVLLSLAAVPVPIRAANPNPIVAVTGGKIHGTVLDPDGAAFKGVPYARPPVGDFRWREPAPVEDWSGVRDAAFDGPPCAQNPYFVHDAKEISKEDCLYLNVWTPAWPPKSTHKAVTVWIPGGGNFGGAWNSRVSGPQDTDPARIGAKVVPAARESFRYDGVDLQVMKLVQHDVVLVTLNYRLGLFGFFSHPELTAESVHHASGNQGILDQIAALRWVRDNISTFGGDPGNVTIFGESAGSFDVSVLMTSPLSRGLFRRAIAQSGAVVLLGDPLALPEAEKRGVSLVASPGAANMSLRELRALPADMILAKEPNLLQKLPQNLGLAIDGYVFRERPADVFASGLEHHVDMLLGNMAHEWIPGSRSPADWKTAIESSYPVDIAKRAVALYQAGGTDSVYGGPAEQWAEDVSFRCPAVAQLVWHSAAGNRAFEYEFSRIPAGRKSMGNMHAEDVPYVFGPVTAERFDDADYAISDAVQQYWTNFAKTGNPNGKEKLPKWPRFDVSSRGYIEFSAQGPIPKEALRRPFCDLLIESLKNTGTLK